MSPVVVLLIGLLIVYVAASGRWQDVFNALTQKKK
jgi:hypothetical protein